MIRLLFRFAVLLVVLVVIGFFGASYFLGSIVKKGVEAVGPKVTKVDVKLDSARLAPLAGSGELKGLVVGNPEGFKTPSAIQIGSVGVDLVPRSIFSDKIVVHSIKVLAPEVTFEGGLQGNNLSKLLENIRGTDSKSKGNANSGSSRKLQVDDLLVTGGKVNLSTPLLGGKSASVPLPDIHLTGLGQNADGITAAELSEKLLNALVESSTKAVAGQFGSLGKNIGSAAQAVESGSAQQVEQAAKSLGDLFKKK